MLYVYAIQQRHTPAETYLPAFQAAVKCQEQITSIAMPGSLAQRYGVVLQELQFEVLKHNSHLLAMASGDNVTDSEALLESTRAVLSSYSTQPLLGANNQSTHFTTTGESLPGDLGLSGEDNFGLVDQSPGSSIVHMIGWSQFDSLVSLFGSLNIIQ